MSAPLVAKWQGLVDHGRFMDVLDDLEKTRLRLSIVGDGLRIDGPQALLSPELGALLERHTSEWMVVLRLSTLAVDSFGCTRLHHAVVQGDLDEVRRHLANGARPNQENRFGQSPFHAAISAGKPEVIEALALAGADLDRPDVDGRTPLHLAIESQSLPVTSFLLINGAEVNRGDFFGLTPLTRAVALENAALAQLLVEYGGGLEDPERSPTERTFLQLVLRLLRGFSEELYQHSLRVADLARCMARDLELSQDELTTVRLGGLLHDLGKVSLPDEIFDLADSDLSDDQVDLLMTHPEDGAEALPAHLVPAQWPVRAVILHHHEKWDGSGFPHGLSGTDIPLAAQLVGLADYYDHLVTHRSYDPAVPHKQALELLNEQAGQHFGEEVLDSLFRVSDLLPFYSPQRR